MLQYIKKYIKGWFLGILFFFIFISFAFWGVGDIFRTNVGYVIKIGNTKVSREFFLAEYQANINNMNKNESNFSKIEKIDLAKDTLRNIANRYLIVNAAKEMGIKVSENILRKMILNNTNFHNELKNNKFDKNIYMNFINRNFGNEENYLEYLRNQVLVEIISNNFEKTLNYPLNLSESIYTHFEERRIFEIATIDKVSEVVKVEKPNDKKLKEFYDKKKDNYFFDQRRSFSYLFVDLEILKKKIVITDEEILEKYEKQKDDFIQPEKREVEQLFFDNEETANKIFKSIDGKDTFKEISEKKNEKEFSYISLGLIEKKQLFNEFEDIVFKLKINEFSNPIKTDLGWHILKVTKIVKSKVKDFDSVKNNIKKDIILNKSYDELDITINEVENELSKGSSLEDISKELNLEIIKKKLFEKKDFFETGLDKIFKKKKFYDDIFNKNMDSELFIEEIKDGFFITRVDEINEKKQKNFEEAYNDVVTDWFNKESIKNINKKVQKFKENLNKNKGFIQTSDLLMVDSRTTKKVNREEMIKQGFSEKFVEEIFKGNKNSIFEKDSDTKYYIIKAVTDLEILKNDKKFQEIKKNIEKSYGIDNFKQLSYILEKKFPIKINDKMFNDFIETLQ